MYGPSVSHFHEPNKYQEVRVLPKLMALSSEMFRFQACRFNSNEHFKENCARYWTQELGVQYSYCLECSQQGYYSQTLVKGQRSIIDFNPQSLQQLGAKLGENILQFADMVNAQEKKMLERKKMQKLKRKKGKKKQEIESGDKDQDEKGDLERFID